MLDRLISEIANLLQMSEEQVRLSFTQDHLNRLLDESKCEDPGVISNLIDSLEVPCQDSGTQFDIDAEQTDISDPVLEDPFDPSECRDAAEKVNQEIKIQLDEYNNINILLNKLIEFQDHIKVVGYYYEERVKRAASVLNDYRPLLTDRNRLQSEVARLNREIKRVNNLKSKAYAQLNTGSINYTEYIDIVNTYSEQIKSINEDIYSTNLQLSQVNAQINLKSSNYSVLNTNNPNKITGLNPDSNSITISQFNQESGNYLTNSDINSLRDKLRNYSEYLDVSRSSDKSYQNIVNNPRLKFEIKLQGLESIEIEREIYNEETGESNTFTINFPIRDNPLLLDNSFKNGFSGCSIKDISPKKTSSGLLYTNYYNKLADPFDKMFTIEDRGLTSNLAQLDPALIGSDNITKKENGKDYFIKDVNKMNSFYKDFESTFEKRKNELRSQVNSLAEANLRASLITLARKDVDLLIASGGFYTNLIEDSQELRTIVDNINRANIIYVQTVGRLGFEIDRLKARAEELKPDPEQIEARLKQLNSKCFEKPNTASEPECQDVKDKLGSDPLYLNPVDGSLPNFTQLCYWKEFANVANIMGLAPIPNGPTELRYWPVGFIIPTPAGLVKIPLPIIWIPIICISSPLGVVVVFLTINGIFISPIVFFVSSSSHKQHIVTVRGPSPKFGSDQFDEIIKPTIKIPVAAVAAKDAAIRLAKRIQTPQSDIDRLESLKRKRSELEAEGNTDLVKKVDERIAQLEKKKQDAGKTRTEILKDILDSKESAKDDLNKIKSDIKKKIDAIGRPPTIAVERLKEKASKRNAELRAELVKALENNDLDRVKEIRRELKSDGIDIKDKVKAISDDILKYFDDLEFPSLTIPKDESKLNPLPSFGERIKFQIPDKISNLSTRIFSNKDKSIKNILKMDLAKYRKEIDRDIPDISIDLNTDDASDRVAELMDRVLKKVVEFSTKVENRPSVGFSPEVISQLSSLKIDLDPFAPCCSKPAVDIDLGPTSAIIALFNLALPLVTDYVKNLDNVKLKSLFGGKQTVGIRDIRLSLISLITQRIPDSIEVPIPEFGLSQSIAASNALLSSIQMPQASFPAEVKAFSAPKQISINLNTLIKKPLYGILEGYLNNNVGSFPRDIGADFINMSGADLKQILYRFLDLKFAEVESILDPIYSVLAFAKSAKGSNLNVLEKSVHSLPVYGLPIEKQFSIKTLIKMNLPDSSVYWVIDEEALERAIKMLAPLLSPIARSPVGYFMVAGAAVTGNLNLIRKLHPILNFDDLPPWERLTIANVMLMLFLDEFIYEAANKVGFFRQYV